MMRTIVLGALLLASATSPTLAQEAARGGTADQQKACRNDVVKLCRGMQQADDMQIYQCLQSNAQKLSKRCREALAQGR